MQHRGTRSLLALLLFFLPACEESDDPAGPGDTPPQDTTAPAAVNDLQLLSFDAASATIRWTAPGDDGWTGTATGYQIGYATEPITLVSWSACSMLPSCPAPAPAGSEQFVQIDAPPVPDLYVALRAQDEAGNWSALSNVAHGHIDALYEVRQLTFEGNNTHPCLDDGFVTWVGRRVADTDEIWIANLEVAFPSPTVLTDDGGEKWHPSSHGSEKIVWMGRARAGDDWEIFVYGAHSVPRYRAFTDNDVQDWFPVLAGGGDFAWQHGWTMFEEVHYWNESAHDETVLTSECCPTTNYSNSRPVADDGRVVWISWDRVGTGGPRIFRWDGTRRDITEIVSEAAHNFTLDAGTMAYEWGAQPSTIRYWDGATIHTIAEGYDPSLDGGRVAFEAWDGHDWEIHLWNGTSIEQITDNEFEDYDPSLSGDRLAWVGRPSGPGGLHQVFYAHLPQR